MVSPPPSSPSIENKCPDCLYVKLEKAPIIEGLLRRPSERKIELHLTISFNEQWQDLPFLNLSSGRVKFGIRGGELKLVLTNGKIPYSSRNFNDPLTRSASLDVETARGQENQSSVSGSWSSDQPGVTAKQDSKQTDSRTEKFQKTKPYISTKGSEGKDLSDADLSDADLSNADLNRANLNRANLSRAILTRASLSRVVIDENTKLDDKWYLVWSILTQGAEGKDLSDADLSDANLNRANLRSANLSRANLRGANLSRANLRGANLSRTNLSRANVHNARFGNNPGISEAMRRDLIQRGAIFEDSPGDGDRGWVLVPH